ncbi:GNAT family N-acetyltransferase [Brevundimonas sp.]|uniref:GNAT family N-acetyltransferase n=1 Tax=Brevundimonas sp. TaxID=1871086 RepID=UPI002FDB6520
MTRPESVAAISAETLADLHAAAFAAPWTAGTFAELLVQPGVFAETADDGFILIRVVADEAEILTLAVRPEARRRGLGARLAAAAAARAAALGAERLFLEVAQDNAAARGLYARSGFVEVGRRRGYYARPGATAVDALTLALNLSA